MAAALGLYPVPGQDRHAPLNHMVGTRTDNATHPDCERNLANCTRFSRRSGAREERGE
jgi:hypothetical protein